MLSTLKMIPTKLKHKKLAENYIEAEPVVIEGMNYTAKYIGMTLVESPKGEEVAAGAIKRIVTSSKASTKESPLVLLTISPKGIHIKDVLSNEPVDDVDITRISFCIADKTSGKVFGFVAQNLETEAFECHAYMCGSRKEAQKIALTVAQSFSIAYHISQSGKPENILQTDGESSSGLTLDNKKFSGIYRSITDSRYKRLSDSFAAGSEGALHRSDEKPDEEVPSEPLSMDFNFEKDKPVLSSSLPTQSALISSNKPKTDFTISILPPPSSKGKTSSKRLSRPTPTADLIDVAACFATKNENATETENLDFDFAQLALSRTREA